MKNGFKLTYVNRDLIEKILKKSAQIAISFSLLMSNQNIVYAKETLGDTSGSEPPIEYNIDNLDEQMKKYNEASDFEPVFVPDAVKDDVLTALSEVDPRFRFFGIITVGDLRKLESLRIFCPDNCDLSFLNYCSNLKKLTVPGIKMGRGIIQLPKLKEVEISTTSVDYLDLVFLNNSKEKLDVEILSTYSYNVDLLPAYKNIENLVLNVNFMSNFNFKDLSYLRNLNLEGMKYDIPIFFSKNDYDYLVENGVKVQIQDAEGNDIYDEVMKVDDALNGIIETFTLDDNSSPEEKMDAILVYVLDCCEYDANMSSLGYVPRENESDFYGEGYLTAIFNGDSQICGNYSSLTTALAHRLGIESYLIRNGNHAWNLINIDGTYYFYDATVLDGVQLALEYSGDNRSSQEIIANGTRSDKKKLKWYQVDYDDFNDYRKKKDGNINFHSPKNLPYRLVYKYTGNDKVEVSAVSKKHVHTKIINKSQLFGILSCIGLVMPSTEKRNFNNLSSDNCDEIKKGKK